MDWEEIEKRLLEHLATVSDEQFDEELRLAGIEDQPLAASSLTGSMPVQPMYGYLNLTLPSTTSTGLLSGSAIPCDKVFFDSSMLFNSEHSWDSNFFSGTSFISGTAIFPKTPSVTGQYLFKTQGEIGVLITKAWGHELDQDESRYTVSQQDEEAA
jgi:hypothetical protein